MAYYQRDQLSIRTRTMLADYFAELILIAQSIESFRTALAETQYFNGIQLFRFLDKQEKGFLIPKDFSVLVNDEVKKILHYAFSWFDTSKSGQITRIQFLQFLFPRQNMKLRQLISLRLQQQYSPQQINHSLPMQLDLLRQLIVQIMAKQTKLIPKRRILMDQQDYTLKAVMNCLDVAARGWISADDLYKFMKNYDIDVTSSNVCGLLGISDNDRNGKVSMEQLQWLVQGLETSQSQYRNIVRNSDRKARTKRSKSVCTCKNKSIQKANTKQKSQKRMKTAIKTKEKQNQNIISFMQPQKFDKNDKQLIERKLNFKQQNIKSNRKILKQQTKQVIASNKKETKDKTDKKKKKKLGNHQGQYYQIKNAILALQKQTIQIDQDLKEFQQKLGIKTQLQMQRQLQNAKIKRNIKAQKKQLLVRRFQQLQFLKRQQQFMLYKQQQQLRKKQEQNKRLLELQLEMQRKRVMELQKQKRRVQQQARQREIQLQNIKQKQLQAKKKRQNQIKKKLQIQQNQLIQMDIIRKGRYNVEEAQRKQMMIRKMQRQEQSIRVRQLELKEAQLQLALNRKIQLQEAHLRQMERAKLIQIQNIRMKKQIQNQIYDHEIIVKQQNAIRMAQTQFNWQAQARLKTLYEQQVLQKQIDEAKFKKQSQYFWKYQNYCNNLAQVADPLGIRQHLAQTDKYLLKSRQIRDLIKKDRAISLNRYTSNLRSSKAQAPKFNTQTDEGIQKTPQNRKIILDTIDKRTQQTNAAWSAN